MIISYAYIKCICCVYFHWKLCRVFPRLWKVLKQNKTHIPQLSAPAPPPCLLLREERLLFPVVDNEVDFIQFNIHSN